MAEESIARDLEDAVGNNEEAGDLETGLTSTIHDEHGPPSQHSMAGYYRRPSFFAGGPRPFLGAQMPEAVVPIEQERDAAIDEERSLLRDNNIIPPKHPRQGSQPPSVDGPLKRASVPGFSIPRRKSGALNEDCRVEDENEAPTEATALLAGEGPKVTVEPYGGEDSPENIDKKWEEAVRAGQIQTTWQREAQVVSRYSAPLILTFILQNSLTLTSIFTVGHIGKIELGAVSLGGMTANITGYAVYHGLATSLDTLCAQAYGSGKKELVGLQLQRMVFFLWAITIPIACIWLAGTQILSAIVPEKEIAQLAGQYLKVLIIGAPSYALFESAKRFVQAQGRFAATLYVLLICAPLNVLLHWFFVWVRPSCSIFPAQALTEPHTEARMGLYWLSHRGCHHRDPHANLTLPLRPFHRRYGVLAWLHPQSFCELVADDPPGYPWSYYGIG